MARQWRWLILLVLVLTGAPTMTAQESATTATDRFPSIPEKVTSFGAAICGNSLYLYGGHTGEAHSYSKDEQGRRLWRLDLASPKTWEVVAEGPPLQGLALVSHGGKLYRIGGFTAENDKEEPHDLRSTSAVACFDVTRKKWTDCPSLPEPRSSFDAAVLDDRIYVIGGWKLDGADSEPDWHSTAYALDVKSRPKSWKALPKPPFQRRALAVAAFAGKIYVVGGMRQRGGPTTRVDIYDPQSNTWSVGPSLHGKPMNGFGAAAFAVGDKLYVTTIDGSVQQLSADAKSWEIVGRLKRARFFHRMLPLGDGELLMIGGASMSSGKYRELDVIELRAER